jgi:hypothetical protein
MSSLDYNKRHLADFSRIFSFHSSLHSFTVVHHILVSLKGKLFILDIMLRNKRGLLVWRGVVGLGSGGGGRNVYRI